MSCSYIDLAMAGVKSLSPYQPGKPIEELQRELGLDRVSKLASNENPLGPSAAVQDCIRQHASSVARYPDGNGFALKTALSVHHACDSAGITLGNGSNDVLDMVARAYLGPGREAVFSQYGFAVYPIATQTVGARGVMVPAHTKDHDMPLGHNLQAMRDAITENTRVVFIANPNNPTGTWLEASEIASFLESVPTDVIVVLDEAYLEYGAEGEGIDGTQWLSRFPNLIVTRTFSKIYGIAGLRVGYALSHPDVADMLNRARHPFNVNLLGLAAAEVALADQAHVKAAAELNRAGMKQLLSGLEAFGLKSLPSKCNFLAIDMGQEAQPIFDGLLRQGVIVRPVAAYGMPEYLRVSIGIPEENQHFLDALGEVLG